MCLPTTCANSPCAKMTWWGCGQHIPAVRAQCPSDDAWCTCEPHNPVEPDNVPAGKSCVRMSESERRDKEGRA
ncbi:hypothetical protein JCM8208_000551 [Rhodotorula glutinis]